MSKGMIAMEKQDTGWRTWSEAIALKDMLVPCLRKAKSTAWNTILEALAWFSSNA